MTWLGAGLAGLATDLRTALLFCTVLPISSSTAIEGSDLARAGWAMPVAGAVVGAIGALTYWIAAKIGLPPMPAAMLALVATMIITGGLHEDGLADTADGFGGGSSRERKLAIMRDSRIGTFGVCALSASIILRWSALVTIAEPQKVMMALVAAQVSARATLPAFMRLVSPARTDGLSASAGPPPWGTIVSAGAIAAIVLVILLGPRAALTGLFLLSVAGVLMGALSVKQISGQTGDVIGVLEQIGEIVILLTAVVLQRAGSS
jgi:adenosylcobinamide-GDP ribazoletransferase